MEEPMRLLGDPQKDLHFIHIAGTNRKGSAAAMLSSVLSVAGYVTGLYSSPHLTRVNEQIKIGGAQNSNGIDELTECLSRCLPNRKIIFVFGVMADKNHADMI